MQKRTLGKNGLEVSAIRLVVIFALSGFPQASSTQVHSQARVSDRERLIGAWQLVSLAAPGSDGKTMSVSHPAGMLTYTRDGHVSVQLMYPASGKRDLQRIRS